MAYAAVISLKQTIKRLLNSSHISILPPSRETLEFAYEEVLSLQEVLEKFDTSNSSSSERVNVLDEQIREAVCKLEDLLEANVSNQLLSQSEESCLGGESHTFSFSLDLQELKHDIDSFSYLVYKLKEEYINELFSSLPNEEDDDINISVPSRIYFERNKSKMVGLSDQFCEIRDRLMDKNIVSLLGMAGIGKTTLAKEIFVDPFVLNRFDCRAWVTVGQNYKFERILKDILAQVNPVMNDTMLVEGENELAQYLSKVLNGRTHLIVFDDVWSPHFIFEFLRIISYDSYDCCRFLITTRLRKVAIRSSTYLQVRLLTKEESWNLLREKVFSQYSCPPQLEKAGRKIAENCDGLPLTIVTVAELLSNADEMTLEYWNKAAEIESSVFNDAYDQISKVLLPSYKCLSQHLKACFLYMGVFPQNSEIPRSKLIKLWSAEGIIEPIKLGTLDDFADKYLKVLVSRSLVMVFKKSSRVKTCGLHSVFWHLCKREAEKIKFFHVLSSYTHSLAKGITCQRRLCILNNTLFAIRDVYNTMTSILTARSLLCYGPSHQYPVQICSDLRLLRVLDALTIRFYEFPMEVLKLVQLRYLALTYNGKLPPSIFKLWNLQFLIVHRHVSIKSSGSQSYLPIEIWDMKELKHLQIMGSDLQHLCGALLPNLLTLLDVSAHNCTKGIFERIPNLKKLGIRIELAPNDIEPLSCFDHISHLHKLESLKCVVVNPGVLRSKVVAPLAPISNFPTCLKRLSLSGFGYPWEDMRVIASLRNLEVLKLRCYAFRGPKWETKEMEFLGLKYLLIEDTDLVHWTVGEHSFPMLKCLSIKHCYQLKQIPEIGHCFDSLRTIELTDCNPLVVTCATTQMQKYKFDVSVHSSWDDGKLKP